MTTKTITAWPLKWAAIAGTSAVLVLFAVIQEMNPLRGDWKLFRVIVDGKATAEKDSRIWIEIDGDRAKIIGYNWCGSCPDSDIADGFMVRRGNRVDLHRRIRMTPELEKQPSDHFTITDRNTILYETSDLHGKLEVWEFRRESNSTTLLDLFGWR